MIDAFLTELFGGSGGLPAMPMPSNADPSAFDKMRGNAGLMDEQPQFPPMDAGMGQPAFMQQPDYGPMLRGDDGPRPTGNAFLPPMKRHADGTPPPEVLEALRGQKPPSLMGVSPEAITDFAPTDPQRMAQGRPPMPMTPGAPPLSARLAPPVAPAPLSREALIQSLVGKSGISAIAGGFAGGDPRFAGGAFMKGMGGALGGALKSNADDLKNSRDDETINYNRGKDSRDSGLKEREFEIKKSDSDARKALYKLYGEAAGRRNLPGARDPIEDYVKAQIIIKERAGILRGDMPNEHRMDAESKAKRAEIEKQIKELPAGVYKKFGLDANGDPLPERGQPQSSRDPQPAPNGRPGGGAELKGTGTEKDPYQPRTREDLDALPSGAIFRNPKDGQLIRKSDLEPEMMGDSQTAVV